MPRGSAEKNGTAAHVQVRPGEAQAQGDGPSCTNSASERSAAVLVTDEEPPSEGEGTDAAVRRGLAQTAQNRPPAQPLTYSPEPRETDTKMHSVFIGKS